MKLTRLSVGGKFPSWTAPGRKWLYLSHRTMVQVLGSNCGQDGDAIHLETVSPRNCADKGKNHM